MTKPANYAPIAIFAYNRLSSITSLITSLEECPEFVKSKIFIFVDGSKTQEIPQNIKDVRNYVKNISHPDIQVICSEKNKGLAKSIYSGVSKVCKEHGKCIILEDDLVLSPKALDYFNKSLIKYKDTQHIWSVCAYTFASKRLQKHKEALILPYSYPWGWATWQRAWENFSLDTEIDTNNTKSLAFQKYFDSNGLRNTRLLDMALKGHIDSWYIKWFYCMAVNGASSIFPPKRYIENFGMRDGGTHAGSLNPTNMLLPRESIETKEVIFPETTNIDFWALDIIANSWEVRVHRLVAFLGKIKRFLKRNTTSLKINKVT